MIYRGRRKAGSLGPRDPAEIEVFDYPKAQAGRTRAANQSEASPKPEVRHHSFDAATRMEVRRPMVSGRHGDATDSSLTQRGRRRMRGAQKENSSDVLSSKHIAMVREETQKLLSSQLEPIRSRLPLRVAECSQSFNNNALERYSPDFESDASFSSSDESMTCTCSRDAYVYTPDSDWSSDVTESTSDSSCDEEDGRRGQDEDEGLFPSGDSSDNRPLPPSCTCVRPPLHCVPRYWTNFDQSSPEFGCP